MKKILIACLSILVVCTLFPTNVFAISDYKASESFEKVEEIASAEDIIGTIGFASMVD